MACIQGHVFNPAKPLQNVPVTPPFAVDRPRLEPLNLAELFPAMPQLARAALPSVDRPASPAAPAVTTSEQHAVFLEFVRDFEAKRAQSPAAGDTLDYSVALIHLGRIQDAIAVLLARETAQPGDYATAANLGTAYELGGNLEEAVLWIGRGVERNPESHQGTEWLHLAILHAKLGLRSDENWLRTHSVIEGLVTLRTAEEIVRAIDYQLGERLQFVRPQDAVVCDLFYQAALRVSGDNADERRAIYCEESLRFGEWRKAEIAKLKKA